MSSRTDSHQVTNDLAVGNEGENLTDLFDYSDEFERQFEHQIKPNDFKIISLLYESKNDNAFLELMEKEVRKQEADNPLPPPIAIQTKDRIQWTCELQSRFVRAIEQLGGPAKSTPSSILYLMNVKEGLTLAHVKSHLQTHRNNLDKELAKLSKTATSALVALEQEGTSKSNGSASVGLSESTGSASIALDPEAPSESRTAKKRSKGKQKASKGTLDKKIKNEVQIEEVLKPQNHFLKLLKDFSDQTIGNFEQVTDVGVMPTLQCTSNLIQQHAGYYYHYH